MRGRGLARLTGLTAGAVLLCGAIGAPSAGASSNSLTLSFSPSDPSGITPVTVTANGSTATAGEYLIVAVVPASTGCPSQYENISGGYWINQQMQPAGTFTVNSAARQLKHESYDICGWLADSSSVPPVLGVAAAMAVSNPDTLSLSVSSPAVTDGDSTTVSVDGVADVDNPDVYVTEKPAADGGCAANPGADTGMPWSGYDPASVTFGTFSHSETDVPGSGSSGPDALPAGAYELCGWLMDADGSSTRPLAPVAPAP